MSWVHWKYVLLIASLPVCLTGCQWGFGGNAEVPDWNDTADAPPPPFNPGQPGVAANGVRPVGFEQSRPNGAGYLFSGESGPADTDQADAADESLLDSLTVNKLTERVKEAAGQGPDQTAARARFAQAEALYRQKKFTDAAGVYADAASSWPASSLEQDALFMAGESYFFADDYSAASKAYGTLLKKYSNSRHLEKAVARQFLIARYWEQLGAKENLYQRLQPNFFDEKRPLTDTVGNAVAIYNSIRLNDPTGTIADDALMAIANHHFIAGNYDDAEYHYKLLRRDYPKSPHLFDAYVLGIQSKMRSYQGADYDGTPLAEAAKLIKQIRIQFPQRFEAERGRLEKVQAEVRAQQAMREWKMAQYYEEGDNYGGARVYYQRVIDIYPTSNLAERAQQRLAEIRTKPDNAPNYAPWLTNLFESDKRKRR